MSGNGLAFADYAVVAAFFAVMVAVGVFFARRQKGMAGFFGGGREVPWWLSGISFYMCSFSALAFVMYSALAYKYGWVPVTVSWLSVPAVLLGCRLTAARWRRAAETSPLEFIEARYGNTMRQGLTWLCLPMNVLDDAFKLLAIGTVVGVGMGFPVEGAIAVSGLIILSYTFMGGLWAALVADFIQFFVLLSVILVLPFLCLAKSGGFSAFLDKVPPGFFHLTSGPYDWTYMLVFFVVITLNLASSWAMVQRYYSTRSEKDARKVGNLVAVLLFVGPPLFFLPAMAARTFLPEIPPERMNEVYALVCRAVLPVGLVGMVIAAMFSATMSTLAGHYNAVASVLTNDFYLRMVAPKASEKARMTVARLSTLLVGTFVIGLTFVMRHAQGAGDLFDLSNRVFSVFLPPIALPTLAGLLCPRVSRKAGPAALLFGIGCGLVAFVAGAWFPVLRGMITMNIITFSATLAALAYVSWRWPDDLAHDPELRGFLARVSTPGPDRAATGSVAAFVPMIGGGLLAIGLVLVIATLASRPFAEVRLSVSVGAAMALLGLLFILIGRFGRKDVSGSSAR